MESKICMNTSCGAKTTLQWKKGWELKSGETADLCFNCGSAYENLVYCDTFHPEETGWRECSLCNKRLHCGCSAAAPFIEIQDFGGVWCISCAQNAGCHSARIDVISSEAPTSRTYSTVSDVQNTQLSNKLDSDNTGNRNLLSLSNISEPNVPRYLSQSQTDLTKGSFGQMKPEVKRSERVGVSFCTVYAQPSDDKPNAGVKDMHEPQIPSLSITLRSPSETPNFGPTFDNGVEGDKSKSTLFQSGQRPRHILPKPPKGNIAKGSDANKSSFSPIRVARPPAEGRLRNQLLPRYWPRITDQELQKLSGDLNSTIVPLFEKVLSASDASRIGRLVLPKACAEAYFPPINQSEGLPLKIQDVKGNEWTFQFRFWPNNNSRMYVLEGVTPCIQSMQLQAGDTVTFSRIDPGGKLVIGYRKASNGVEMQDSQTSSVNHNSAASGESFYSDVTDGLSVANGVSGLQSVREGKDNNLSDLPQQSNLVNGTIGWNKSEKLKGKVDEDALQQLNLTSDKKRIRNIGSKSKRLLMHTEDAMELRLTWEETQDLLRPPPSVEPVVVTVEDFEFEEYCEPPVLGKKTYFTTRLSGGQEQWAQCDICSKWRKLPADVLLPPNWTCSENVWDSSRSSCPAPEEMSAKELENVFGVSKDFKKRRVAEGPRCEPSGLDALATAATLGDHEEPSTGATTKHPRHRPGCTCIVCIQPPSGKGRHKPSCVCNVCLTVKRRFKTLMMRKKKRQYEREVEMAEQKKSHSCSFKGSQLMKNPSLKDVISKKDHSKNEISQGKILSEGESSSKGHIDLNSHPIREEDATVDAQQNTGMMSLAQAASSPLEMYMKSNGPPNILCMRHTDTDTRLVQQRECNALVVKEQEQQKGEDEGSKKSTLS